MKTSHAVIIRIVALARHRIPRHGRLPPQVHGGPVGGPPHGGCGVSGGDPGCMVNLSPAGAGEGDKDSRRGERSRGIRGVARFRFPPDRRAIRSQPLCRPFSYAASRWVRGVAWSILGGSGPLDSGSNPDGPTYKPGARVRERAGISKPLEQDYYRRKLLLGRFAWNTEKTSPLTSDRSRKIWSTGGRSGWSRA